MVFLKGARPLRNLGAGEVWGRFVEDLLDSLTERVNVLEQNVKNSFKAINGSIKGLQTAFESLAESQAEISTMQRTLEQQQKVLDDTVDMLVRSQAHAAVTLQSRDSVSLATNSLPTSSNSPDAVTNFTTPAEHNTLSVIVTLKVRTTATTGSGSFTYAVYLNPGGFDETYLGAMVVNASTAANTYEYATFVGRKHLNGNCAVGVIVTRNSTSVTGSTHYLDLSTEVISYYGA